jgi:pimeloyl-ACP methyl ester carboxylesterase/Tfp pilus assembly protein PilZ
MERTLFMIHGMFCGAWCWEKYKGFFEDKGYKCVTTTLRHHDLGLDEMPDPRLGTTSLLDYAEDLEDEIRALDTTPIIVGHSMGGLLAQILGNRGLAKGLVLLTPAPPSGVFALKLSVIKSFWSGMKKWGWWKKPLKATFGEAVYGALNLMPEEEQKDTYNKFVYESGRAAKEIGFYLFDSQDASKVDESSVTCPVLVIGGSQDRLTPASVVKKVGNKYRTVSTYMEYPNHAHWVIGEPDWEEIANYVSHWLTENVKREYERKPYSAVVNYIVNEGAYTDSIQNISAGGVFIQTAKQFFEGQEVAMTFPLPISEENISINGEIARISELGMGVKFKMDNPKQEANIDNLVNRIPMH